MWIGRPEALGERRGGVAGAKLRAADDAVDPRIRQARRQFARLPKARRIERRIVRSLEIAFVRRPMADEKERLHDESAIVQDSAMSSTPRLA